MLGKLTDLGVFLTAPDYPDQGRFSWSLYLEETGSKAVPAEAFKVVRTKSKRTLLDSSHFEVGEGTITPGALVELHGVSVVWAGRKQQ